MTLNQCPNKRSKYTRVFAYVLSGMATKVRMLGGIRSRSSMLGGIKVWAEITCEQLCTYYLNVDKPEMQWISTAYSIDYNVYANVNWIVEGNN